MNAPQYAQMVQSGPHPWWCAGGHRCDAALGGSHSSLPEEWIVGTVRLVVRRMRRHGCSRSTVEVRFVVPVDEADERRQRRRLQAAVQAFVQQMQHEPRRPHP